MNKDDKQAFLNAYKEVHESLMRFCIVRSRGIMDPKDLANDTILVGLENFSKLKNRKAFLSYLFSTANNICLNQNRRKKFSGDYKENDAYAIADSCSSIENSIDISFLYQALDKLPPLQKEAVTLFEISDLPIKEIMVIQNSGESAVKQRIKRGREKLAQLMQEKDRKKIAVLTSIALSTKLYSMDNLDIYFQTIKQQPLPLSSQEATGLINNFQLPPTPPTAAKLITKTIIKKGLFTSAVVGGIITSSVLLSNQIEDKSEPNSRTTLIASTTVDAQPLILETSKIKETTELKREETSTQVHQSEIKKTISTHQQTPSPEEPIEEKNNYFLNNYNFPTNNFQNTSSPSTSIVSTPAPSIDSSSGKGEIFSLEGIDEIKIEHLGEKITFKTWERNELKIEAHYEIEAKKEKDYNTVLKNVSYETEKENNQFIVKQKSTPCTSKSISLGKNRSKTTVRYRSGDKAQYNKLNRTYIITIPKKINLKINGRYSNIIMPELDGNLNAKMHNTTFKTQNINGNLKLSLNYSKSMIGDFENGEINLYNSKLNFGNSNDLKMESKYSKTEGKKVNSIDLTAYQGKTEFLEIKQNLDGNLKYHSITCLKPIQNSKISAYQSKIYFNDVSTLSTALKYCTLEANQIKKLNLSEAYSCKFKIESIDEFKSSSSKYSNYSIETINTSIKMTSYSDKLKVESIASSFEDLIFSGKYTSYNLALDGNPSYKINVSANYGKLNYDRSALLNKSYEKEGNVLSLSGFMNETDSDSKIKFDCYQCGITIE